VGRNIKEVGLACHSSYW